MKKFVKYLLVICLMIPFAFMFAGCGENNEPNNVMSLSVNPDVSFVLDSNNNVVSVKYENEDAGTIYADVNFDGKSLEDTIQIFIERAAISGHITLDGDKVTIDITGQANIEDLKNAAKQQVEKTFESMGVEVNVAYKNLTEEARRAALQTKATLLAPEKTAKEISEMSNEDLVKLINDKQNEYKDLAYTQIQDITKELESTVLKAVESAKATLESAETTLNDLQKQLDALPDSLKSTLQEQVDNARAQVNQYKTVLNQKVQEFQDAKNRAIADAKAKYEEVKNSLIENFKNQVNNQKNTFIAHLEVEKNAGNITQEQYDYWVNLINSQTQMLK